LGIGVVFVAMILMFYGEAMATGFESVDNDGDSEDWDGDGYPTGQERKYNTNPWDGDSHPDPNIIAPDPPEKWIDEDGIDWDGNYKNWNQGHDDDGDCTGEGWVDPDSFELPRDQDRNHDGVDCNVHYYMNTTTNTVYRINSDPNVDEDPNDELFLKESLHRAFVLGFGKIGFGFLIGIFVPLFLATGLVRDEIENGTLHYIMAKPIARAEILAYRLLGYIAMVWPYSTVLILLTGIVTGFLAPSESVFRFHDMSAWLGVLLASWLVMLAYGTIFCTLGVMSPKFGLWLAIGLGVWEFSMAMMSLAAPNFPLTWLSISHWGIEIINCTSVLAYPDQSYMINMASQISWGSEIALAGFYSPPSVVAGSPFISLLISIFVLLTITIGALFVGQSSLKRKELN
jgi:ABC-type transport system involved in multi-copper enzyme maturation permease subunit